jgi:hypothetical protein
MTLILFALSAVLLSVGLYRLAQAAFAFPSGRSIHAYSETSTVRKPDAMVSERIAAFGAKLVSRLFPMIEYKRITP